MTGAVLKSIRQQLRKRWLRCAICLCALMHCYVTSAGLVTTLVFHPQINSVPAIAEFRHAVLAFYQPVLMVVGSDRCPHEIPRYMACGMGDGSDREIWLAARYFKSEQPEFAIRIKQYAIRMNPLNPDSN